MTSIDGSAWDLAPVNTTAFEVVPWAGGLAGAGRSAAPFWWRPGASEAELLMPPALAPRPDHFQSLVAGREVGIGLMERRRPEERSEQRSRPVLVGSNVYRVETDDGLELIRDGQIIWRERDSGSTAKLSGLARADPTGCPVARSSVLRLAKTRICWASRSST